MSFKMAYELHIERSQMTESELIAEILKCENSLKETEAKQEKYLRENKDDMDPYKLMGYSMGKSYLESDIRELNDILKEKTGND